MNNKTDIEIAQECAMEPIAEIAKRAHVDEKYLEQYGRYKAKVDPVLLKEPGRENGKLIRDKIEFIYYLPGIFIDLFADFTPERYVVHTTSRRDTIQVYGAFVFNADGQYSFFLVFRNR